METGYFLVIEGIDGSGKSTLVANLATRLQANGHPNLTFAEPTREATGLYLRRFLRGEIQLSKEQQLQAFIEDRKVSVAKNIKPTLKAGKHVLLDRYCYSTAAYQANHQYTPQTILAQNMDQNFPTPDLLLYLEIEPKNALQRILARGNQQETFETLTELERIADNYCKILPTHTIYLNAARTAEQLLEAAYSQVENFLKKTKKLANHKSNRKL